MRDKELNSLGNISYLRSYKPREIVNIDESLDIFQMQFLHHLGEDSENYKRSVKFKQSKLKPIIKFQEEFDSLLKKFYLEKRWIAMCVFKAIWDGTGKLEMDPNFLAWVPIEIVNEVEDKLGIKRKYNTVYDNDLSFLGPISSTLNLPPIEPFTYDKPYTIASNLEEYKVKAIEAYRQHLDNYLSIIENSFKKNGYKLPRRHFDYKQVKRLVWWNIQRKTYKEISQEIYDSTGKEVAPASIKASLEKFKEYDLPLRPEQSQE